MRGFFLGMVGLASAGCCGLVRQEDPLGGPPEPLPTLLVSQAVLRQTGQGGWVPQPATLSLWRTDGTQWWEQTLVDPSANVFHKAVFWGKGVLTIGGQSAHIKHWTRAVNRWSANVLWQPALDQGITRIRDLEVADVLGDAQPELVVGTHDQGIVAVGRLDGNSWVFETFDAEPDTLVHEVEVGDVDGDGHPEIYATRSGRNLVNGPSQPGQVVRYDRHPQGWIPTVVVGWPRTHAKEVLVADVNRDGTDELYVVREGEQIGRGAATRLVAPVQIVRMEPQPNGTWHQTQAIDLPHETQCRFLVAGDVDGDGTHELVAAGKTTGLWLIEPTAPEGWRLQQIDADSGGFEHAIQLADLDRDGQLELYVASEPPGYPRQLRRYTHQGDRFERTTLATLAGDGLVWSIAAGSY